MKIVIIGPGALGCLIAATIASNIHPQEKTGPELWLLDHKPERARLIKEKGLLLEADGQKLNLAVRITCDPSEIGPADLIILCVKYKDVATALSRAKLLSSAGTILITLQNGIGHLPLLESTDPGLTVALGVSAQGATLLAPGHVRHAGSGPTLVGFVDPGVNVKLADALANAAGLLSASGIETMVVDNILDRVWTKLFINVGINALTAINDCPNGQLLEMPEEKEKLVTAVQEAEAVARAKGINIVSDPVAATEKVCIATQKNISSMLQDVRNRQQTEIDSINGAVLAEAHRLGIPAPVNEELLRAIKEIEKSYLL